MMTTRQRFRFLWEFARQDLFETHARRTTWVIALTVAILTGLMLMSYGLVLGNRRVRLQELKDDPLALCLWVEPGDGPLGNKISPDLLASLRTALARELEEPEALYGCYPLYECSFDWFYRTEERREASIPFTGRTLAPGDPLLAHWPLVSGQPFRTPDQHGVILTEGMLRTLGKEPKEPMPKTLRLRSPGGAPVEVPVVGVTRKPFPHGHSYVLTEAYQLHLLTDDPNMALDLIYSGPVPDTWPPVQDLPPVVKNAFAAWDLQLPFPEEKDGQRVWKLQAEVGKPPIQAWRKYLDRIRELMREQGIKAKTDRAFVHVRPANRPAEAPERKGYDMVGVYVRDLPDLHPAAEAAKKAGLRPQEDVIAQIEGIDRSAQIYALVLSAVVIVVGGISFWNITVIQALRARQKITEIGMVKALGMENRLLRQVYVTEALILWALGTVTGIALGWVAGQAVAWGLSGRFTAFACPWYLIGAVVAIGWLACWGSTLVATHEARQASPIETLSAP